MKPLFSSLLRIVHYIFFRIKVFGTNKIHFKKTVILVNSRIDVTGENNKINLGSNVTFRKTSIKIKGSNNTVSINDNVKISEYCKILIEGDNCELYIGNKTTIGSGDFFCGESNTRIYIGEDCMLSTDISMSTSDFHSIIDLENKNRINPPQNIHIGAHTWIGYGSKIMKGANIKGDSIIATKALVAGKSYPANVILAGIPSKIIKTNVTWSREKLTIN